MTLKEKGLFLGLGYMPMCDRPHWDDFPYVMGIDWRRQHNLYRWQHRGWMPAGDLRISSSFIASGWLEWIRLRPALEREILLLWRPRTGDSLQQVSILRRMRLRVHQMGYRLPKPAEVMPATIHRIERTNFMRHFQIKRLGTDCGFGDRFIVELTEALLELLALRFAETVEGLGHEITADTAAG